MEGAKKSGQESLPAALLTRPKWPRVAVCLFSGSGGRAGRLRIGLGNADVAADLILANLVHYDLFRYMCAGDVEEDGLVEGAVLLSQSACLQQSWRD